MAGHISKQAELTVKRINARKKAERPVDYNDRGRSYLLQKEFSSHHWATPFFQLRF